MSEPKDKKTGPNPEKRSGGHSGGKRAAKKPAERPPKRSTGGQKPPAKKGPPLTSQQKILKGLYIALTVVSAVIVLAYIGVNLFAAPPKPKPGPGGVGELTRPPEVTTTTDASGNIIEIEIPGLPADRKKEFYTFLVVGQSQDSGGKLSDTMMLVAYDVPNQKLSVMNLPRDTWARYNGRTQLLNAVYNAAGGYNDDEKGVQGLKTAVRDLTGVYPDFHVVIQWEALGELVDAIGGVYFDVPFDMYYYDVSQHFEIDVKGGYHLLDGEDAMGVVRWRQNSIGKTGKKDDRYGYAEGDLGRIKTQQAFMKAVIAKCIQPDVLLGNLGEYIEIFEKNVFTDLSVANMAYFGKAAIGGLDMENVSFVTLPNRTAGDGAHLLPIGSQIVKEINNGFNPYEHDIRLGELRLADASPLVTPTPDPEESGDPEASGSPDPDESPRPTGSGDDVLLPPGTFTRPSASPRPGESEEPEESRKPGESARPEGSPRPGESGRPAESGKPAGSPRPSDSARPSGDPGGIVLPGGTPIESGKPSPTPVPPAEPTHTPEAPEPTPAPPAPTPDEEPVLPPI